MCQGQRSRSRTDSKERQVGSQQRQVASFVRLVPWLDTLNWLSGSLKWRAICEVFAGDPTWLAHDYVCVSISCQKDLRAKGVCITECKSCINTGAFPLWFVVRTKMLNCAWPNFPWNSFIVWTGLDIVWQIILQILVDELFSRTLWV